MAVIPGQIYLAPRYQVGVKGPRQWWRVEILSKPRHGNVRVRWLAGKLVGKEARLEARTLRAMK